MYKLLLFKLSRL